MKKYLMLLICCLILCGCSKKDGTEVTVSAQAVSEDSTVSSDTVYLLVGGRKIATTDLIKYETESCTPKNQMDDCCFMLYVCDLEDQTELVYSDSMTAINNVPLAQNMLRTMTPDDCDITYQGTYDFPEGTGYIRQYVPNDIDIKTTIVLQPIKDTQHYLMLSIGDITKKRSLKAMLEKYCYYE